MKKLYQILALGSLAGLCLAAAGCDSAKDKLDKRRTGEEVVYISKNDNYTGYARRVREKYPEQVKDIRTDELWPYISEMNGDKELIHYNNKATTAVLPKF